MRFGLHSKASGHRPLIRISKHSQGALPGGGGSATNDFWVASSSSYPFMYLIHFLPLKFAFPDNIVLRLLCVRWSSNAPKNWQFIIGLDLVRASARLRISLDYAGQKQGASEGPHFATFATGRRLFWSMKKFQKKMMTSDWVGTISKSKTSGSDTNRRHYSKIS